MAPTHPTSTASAPAEMSWEEVDTVLADLGSLVPRLIDDYRAARAEAHRWSQAESSMEENRDWASVHMPDPQRAITAARAQMAHAAAAAAEKAVDEMTAWWADAATYALGAAVLNRPVLRVHLGAADPSMYLEDPDFATLPPPLDDHRDLAGLAARMEGSDMIDVAQELAKRSGMVLRRSADGEPTLIDDVYPDGRRRRIWGSLWTHYRLPALASTGELVDILTANDAPQHVIDDVRAVREAVQDVVRAKLAVDPPDEPDADESDHTETRPLDDDTLDALFVLVAQAPEVLADYARTITHHLDQLRTRASR